MKKKSGRATAVLALVLTLLAGCRSGPTPEEQEREAQARRERETRAEEQRRKAEERRRQKEAQHRSLLARQQDVVRNRPGRSISAANMAQAADLLDSLNKAIGKDPTSDKPLVLLDTATGKLTLRHWTAPSREFLLRHVQKVTPWWIETTSRAGGGPSRSNKGQGVRVIMGERGDVIGTNDGGTYSWEDNLRLSLRDAEATEKLEACLKELMAIYGG